MSSTTVTFATVKIIALLQTIEALADNDNEKITWHCRKELKGSQNTANQPHPVSCPTTVSWLTWALLMRKWRGAFNFGPCTPKMLTSDDWWWWWWPICKGRNPGGKHPFFFGIARIEGGPHVQIYFGQLFNSYLPQNQCILNIIILNLFWWPVLSETFYMTSEMIDL